jgi:adenosylhomocysteine nucleosidase
VGWLDSSVPYRKGSIDDRSALVQRLRKLAAQPINLTRGFHTCPYCRDSATTGTEDDQRRGNGEIRVAGANGIVYASPVLICHYIDEHNYLPPDEFLDAVRNLQAQPAKIAIVAAIERELRPLIQHWSSTKAQHDGRELIFYETTYAVAVCGGIGPESARRTAEAVIARYSPRLLISAGIAGGLAPELKVGETIFPSVVIDARDSSRHETAVRDAPIGATPLAKTILISYPEIAGAEQKQKLGKSYGGHAVDMEAASVARAAEAHQLPFIAIKSISDDINFELPQIMAFVHDGQLQSTRFAFHVAVRPWLWLKVARLARNTRLASENLCAWLRESALTNTIVPGTNS